MNAINQSNKHSYSLTNNIEKSFDYISKKLTSIYSYCTPISQEVKPPRLSEESIKNSMRDIKKLYMGSSLEPNLFHCFIFPHELVQHCKSLSRAIKAKNKEFILDSKLKIVKTSFNAAYSISSLLRILVEIKVLLGLDLHQFTKITPAVGIAACAITGAIECKNLKRQLHFHAKCKKDFALLETEKLNNKALNFLPKYIGTPYNIEIKNLAKLAHRVSPWFAEKLVIELPTLLENIHESKDNALREESLSKALTLINNAKIQTEKKIIHQILKILSTALLITAFATLLITAPYAVPIALFVGSSLIGTSAYVFYSGTHKHSGWEFKPKECIPEWTKRVHRYFFQKSSQL